MKRILFFIIFLAALLLGVGLWKTFQNRATVIPERVESAKIAEYFQEPQNKIVANGKKEFSFENVTFTYDSNLFSDIKARMVAARPLEDPDDKPDYVYPKHIEFDFSGFIRGESDEFAAQMRISRLDEYEQLFANADVGGSDQINKFKQMLESKNKIAPSDDKQMPFVEFADASQMFHARAQIIDFQDGRGLLFLTQINQEYVIINNTRLEYIFQGLTNDGKHIVYASFPVSADGLPADDKAKYPAKYEKLNNYYFADEKYYQLYSKYSLEVANKLNRMPPTNFTPNLNKVEDLIHSLNIK